MKRMVRKSIRNVKPYVPGKPIAEVKREMGLRNVVKLASNENPYPPSPKVLKAIQKASETVNRYPDSGCFYLRQKLAKKLKIAQDRLIFGNGSDEVIALATKVFLNETDEVIMARPSFLMYDIFSNLAGARIKSVPLTPHLDYDLTAMKKAISPKTKIIFLGNPDNPSGQYFTQRQMADFLKGIRKNILVFIDEAYYEYVDAKEYVDSIGLLKKYKNVLVTRTFSKMYGLAGLRIGYGIAHPEVISLLNRARDPFNVNAVAQAAARACLSDPSYYRKIAREVIHEREWMYDRLQTLGLDYKHSYTNFILIDLKKDAKGMTKKLMEQGVIVRNMNFCGLKNCVRVSIGRHPENKKFIKALEGIL
jgi:histidinol-phosphate aminotransferase